MKLESLWIAAIIMIAKSGTAAPTHLVDEAPISITKLGSDSFLIDFGRVAFGNLRIESAHSVDQPITVHFGEALGEGRINRKPPGTVRYATIEAKLNPSTPTVVEPPTDKRNTTHPKAILTPAEWGTLLPFRWVEIEGWTGELQADQIVRQSAYSSTWDDRAASFHCSDEMLNQIWELCRYSIKATTFAGVYVDGDRERIPYEADAYLNQLSHYATDHDIEMARDTFDLLMKQPTWPTEWAPHMVFMAYADWMHTGDAEWLSPRYESLKTKLLLERSGADGLITSNAQQIKRDDIVDWPAVERDGYVFTAKNTVVNAFHLRALSYISELAEAIGNSKDATHFQQLFTEKQIEFQKVFFDPTVGLYRDGIDAAHHAAHANFIPLAFDVIPESQRATITEWLSTRGMPCSVYGAQYLIEALFENGADAHAVKLMTAESDRSWRHMVESGTTITWEAWDMKYKPNQDWNHAWGAAPANLLPRYVLGAHALQPGWTTARIRPHPSGLTYAKGKIPTPKGPILVSWENSDEFTLSLTLPDGMPARIEVPSSAELQHVYVNGERVAANRSNNYWVLDSPVVGTAEIRVKRN